MVELLVSLLAVIIFAGLTLFVLSLGLALFGVIIVLGLLLGAYIVLRGYYLRWKYGKQPQTQDTVTIIETEYRDISDR